MRVKKQWQPAEPGVMVYVPSGHVAIEDTQQSLAQLSVCDSKGSGVQALSSLSEVSDTILPSLEVDADIQIKTEQVEPCGFASSLRTDSPDTLAHDELNEVFHEVISTPSSAGTDLVAQLMAAAERDDDAFDNTASKSTLVDTPTMMGGFDHVGYESDRTDFQESTPSLSPSHSPSERRRYHRRNSAIGKTSRHFRQNSGLMKRKPLARRLDFGAKKAAKNVKRSLNAQALEDLRSLERSPSHRWTDDERELLCVINRWYTGPDRPAELTVFSEIFNAITGLRLRSRVIRSQFESHLRLYGANAYPMLGRVFAVPFDDPEGRYAQIRALIEEEARTLQLDLRRRLSELTVVSGKAKYAKSPVTRSIYENKVERVSQKISEGGKLSAVQSVPRPAFKMSMPVRVSEDDDWEIVTDVELSLEDDWELVNDFDSIAGSASRTTSQRPHLAFRVWDAASRTEFIEGSFVAQTFVDWPRPFPAPIALEDPSGAGKILALLHLSKKGDTPVYISTASSLLQALSYATTMEQPCIATIDLNAASLQQDHKLHHAAEVFPWLKRQGLARWARYRGQGEYFIWGEIPAEAVLSTKKLNQLICSLNADEDCRQLLDFHAFEPGIKTNVLAAALRERNVVMNSATSRALGKMARMFGLEQGNATLHHVRDFVARVVDGWTVAKADAVDVQTMSFLAATFASALGAHGAGYSVQEVMGAFVEGVEEGTRCIAHWSKSRSGGRRRRFRKG